MRKRPGHKKYGINWQALEVGVPLPYPGTATGAKSNVCRANILYSGRRGRGRKAMQFRSYVDKKTGTIYVERLA